MTIRWLNSLGALIKSLQQMSRILHRRQRPAPLQLLPRIEPSVSHDSIFSRQSRSPRAVASEPFERTRSPSPVTTTRASSPTRTITRINTSKTESAQPTVFITVTTTRRLPEEEEAETPPATKSVFVSAAPQTVVVTVSDIPTTTSAVAPSTTAAGESSQTQGGTSRPQSTPALSQTAKVVLITLGAISGVALLLSILIVVWKKKKNSRKKSDMIQDSNIPEVREPENPFLDPPETLRY
ncbi:hypothetical protein IQ07DRAFT_685637 [Pyrenochaeta sp. DS3sAY3a]|nr:hypothetical protein IQ07DRAFT_685637 [Pyrenochaeta sp. DS3sAY3a]